MVKTRFPIKSIKGIDPAIDARNSEEIRVLAGRNFLWDSKGPKSGFGTFLLGGGQVIEEPDGIAQSIEVGGQSFIFTSKKVWLLNPEDTAFTEIYDLIPVYGAQIDPWRKKWTAAYLSKGIYFAHYDYGLFKLETVGYNYVLVPKTQANIPGIPFQPVAVAETSGRLCILGRKFFGWSAPSNAEKWTPELGGAGQQLLSDRVSGRAVTMASYQSGVLIWTEQGCLVAEFIGGDLVFRYDQMKTNHLPLGAWCIEGMPDGSQLICTKQGIHRTQNASIPESITPIFNEFLRERLTKRDFLQVRLTYVVDYDILYVQFRDTTNHYVETYVLSISLDRWGILNDRHYGIIRYRNQRGKFGYVDHHGVAHRFVDHLRMREVTPGVFEGLDSMLEIGYIKPPELHAEIDTLLEMQEIFVGSHPARPSWSPHNTIDLGTIELNTSACAYFHASVDFTSTRYEVNTVGVARDELFTGITANDIGAPGLFIIDSEKYFQMNFPAPVWDFSQWNRVKWCRSPSGSTQTLSGTTLSGCPGFQVQFSSSLDECDRGCDVHEYYNTFGVLSTRVISGWQKKDEYPECGPIPARVDATEWMADALACGLTVIVEIYSEGGFGPLIHMDTDAPDTPVIQLTMTSIEEVSLTVSTIPLTLIAPLPEIPEIGGKLIRIGFTINRNTESDDKEYSLSVNGSAATSDTGVIADIAAFLSPFNFVIGSDPIEEIPLGEDVWIRKLDIINAVTPVQLAILTAVE